MSLPADRIEPAGGLPSTNRTHHQEPRERYEYRVSWRREGQRRKHVLRQTEAGARRIALVAQGRIHDAHPELDPDAYWCCPGTREYECGCRGVTNAEAWAAHTARLPALVELPVIERRAVEEWASLPVDDSPRGRR